MKVQCTNHLLMIRPVRFEYNPQTAVNNAFQKESTQKDVQKKALKEFDAFAQKLKSKGLDVTVIDDTPEPHKPDSIFPNNWLSMHSNGALCLFPMFAPNRRLERDPAIVTRLSERFKVRKVVDLTHFEEDGLYLEGTGSMVLDREHRIIYACLSERTNEKVMDSFCSHLPYSRVTFHAFDEQGKAIYHTNVLMCVGKTYAVACLDAIRDRDERDTVKNALENTGKEVIPITLEQMNRFAGNMLQVVDKSGRNLLVMSTRAHDSLTTEQLERIQRHNEVVHSPLDTIEDHGGGSARCMIAEIFLPERKLWFQF